MRVRGHLLTMAVALCIAMAACGRTEESPTPSAVQATAIPTTMPTATPTPDARTAILGLWDRIAPDGTHASLDFAADGLVIISGSLLGSYEVLSEHSLVVLLEQEQLVFRIVAVSQDTLQLENAGQLAEYTRAEGNPGLDDAIVGLWRCQTAEGPTALEFTADGGLIDTQLGIGTYTVASENSVLAKVPIAVEEGAEEEAQPESQQQLTVLRIAKLTGDALTLGGPLPEWMQSCDRIPGHPGLAEEIVGLWRDGEGQTYDFTASGQLVSHDADTVSAYRVVSPNTISLGVDVQAQLFNVLKLTDEELQIAGWGYFGEDVATLYREE